MPEIRRKNGSTYFVPERDKGPIEPGWYEDLRNGSSAQVRMVKGGLVHYNSYWPWLAFSQTLPIKRFRRRYRRRQM
jgi:hypothetical protein